MRSSLLCAAVLLAGCNAIPPLPDKVLVPVTVPCVDKLPGRPAFVTDAELSVLDDYRLVLSLRSDQLALRGHLLVLEAVLAACVK